MAEPREQWADWLRGQFDSHPAIRRPTDLSRAGGTKDNGRPRIDPSTVTQWLKGQKPSYDLALLTADVFGADRNDALIAAGYEPAISSDRPHQMPTQRLSVVDAIEADPVLIDEARAHLLNQYELLRRLSEQDSTKVARPLRAVARKRPTRGTDK